MASPHPSHLGAIAEEAPTSSTLPHTSTSTPIDHDPWITPISSARPPRAATSAYPVTSVSPSLRPSIPLIPPTPHTPPPREVAVQVAVRVRPLLPLERAQGCRACVTADADRHEILAGLDRTFKYTHVLGPDKDQKTAADLLGVTGLVRGLFHGYNATIFAYGQTGSGKTHTMGIGIDEVEHVSTAGLTPGSGLVPRAIYDLFDEVESYRRDGQPPSQPDSSRVRVRCQFLEIHQEDVRDLLCLGTPAKDIAVREDADGNVTVAGVTTRAAHSRDELLQIIAEGCINRTTGATHMNQHSSRSHAMVTFYVERDVSALEAAASRPASGSARRNGQVRSLPYFWYPYAYAYPYPCPYPYPYPYTQ